MASHVLKVIRPESFRGSRARARIFINVRGELCSLTGGGGDQNFSAAGNSVQFRPGIFGHNKPACN